MSSEGAFSRGDAAQQSTRHREPSQRYVLFSSRNLGVAVVVVLGLIASALAAYFVARSAADSLLLRFNMDAHERMRSIEMGLDAEGGILASLEGFYGASRKVESHEFGAFVEPELAHRSGVEAVEWLPRVTREGFAAHLVFCDEAGVSDPTIRQGGADGELTPVDMASGTEWFPVLYVASSRPIANVQGLDRGSEPIMREAMMRARDEGIPVATQAIATRHGDVEQRRVFVFQPIYINDRPRVHRDQRRKNLHGFVASRFLPWPVVEGALSKLNEASIDVAIFDLGSGAEPIAGGDPLYLHHVAGRASLPADEYPEFVAETNVSVADRTWLIRCRPTSEYFSGTSLLAPLGTFIAGLLVTALGAAYVGMLLWQRRRISRVVERRTHELAVKNADLRQEIEARESVEEELKRSNAELAQFAYVASHDLQEPLRMVASYCQLLERKHGDAVGESGRKFIHYAVDGAKRMQALISDLLEYSRITTREERMLSVDLDDVVDQVLANLATAIEESGATVERSALPHVIGSAPHLMQLFQNLIANAIKFRGVAPPHVVIDCTAVEAESAQAEARSERVLSVSDNGIGIAPEHQERVFEVFKRLHGRAEFAGTGIGLAVCKKVVERHGGQIWIESDVGTGTRFLFTLPLQ